MLSLLRTKYFQFIEHSRQESFLSACRTTLYKREELVPVVKELDTLPSVPEPAGGGLPVLELGPENFSGQPLHFPLRSRRERAALYFRRGYRMYALVRNGRVIGDMWYVSPETARSPCIHPHLEWFGVRLAANETYGFDLLVDPAERGGGLTNYFLNRVLQSMRERGVRRSYGSFVAQNIPALWMHRMNGYRELPHCISKRYFFYETFRRKV